MKNKTCYTPQTAKAKKKVANAKKRTPPPVFSPLEGGAGGRAICSQFLLVCRLCLLPKASPTWSSSPPFPVPWGAA